jgi:predicted enzyme related to lactoylglutathione lyase
MKGRVVHFEVPYDDADRAAGFYEQAFGWHLQPMPEMNYTLVTTTESSEKGPLEAGAINGGMLQRSEVFSGPLITIEVDDIDAALEDVRRLGGSVRITRQPVGDMGFTAYFHDTEGNLVGLWENA